MLSQNERKRYDRQIMMRGFGEDGQEKLKQAKVVIAGSGGLGSAASIYLAAAGVGTIRIIDHDKVELSNLNRQVLYWDNDIGSNKVIAASEKLSKLNPEVKIEAIKERITETNVSQLVSGFDLIVDAMDNLPTRFLLNRVALDKNMPFFHGAVQGFEGMVTTIIPGKTACLRCVYRRTIPQQENPVVGVTPAVIACIQATEVIKYIVGVGKLLANRFLVYNGLDMQFTELRVKKDPACEHCGNSGGKKTSER